MTGKISVAYRPLTYAPSLLLSTPPGRYGSNLFFEVITSFSKIDGYFRQQSQSHGCSTIADNGRRWSTGRIMNGGPGIDMRAMIME